MQCVRTGLDIDEYLAAHTVSIFGRQVVGDDAEFTNRVQAGLHTLRFESDRSAGVSQGVVDTVDVDLDLIAVLPACRKNAFGLRTRAARCGGACRPRQLEVVAPVQRYL